MVEQRMMQGHAQGQVHIVLRLMLLCLLISVLLHQQAMATHTDTHAVQAIIAADQAMQEQHTSCPARPTQARICTAITGVLQRVPLTSLLLVFLAALAITLLQPVARVPISRWLWPPGRRRALLQVFLC